MGISPSGANVRPSGPSCCYSVPALQLLKCNKLGTVAEVLTTMLHQVCKQASCMLHTTTPSSIAAITSSTCMYSSSSTILSPPMEANLIPQLTH
eukprot:1160983-Pelagomonas_calceolata.AAC.6